MDRKEAAKELLARTGEINVDVNNNIATPTLPTTPHYINSWGCFDSNLKLHIEQISPNVFFYNQNGQKGISLVQNRMDEKGKKPLYQYIEVIGNEYRFKQKIYSASLFYNVPSVSLIQEYLKGNFKPRSYNLISKDVCAALKELFDFSPLDLKVSELHIGQSWIKPLRNNFFFYMIDSTLGAGKTTLGELEYFLMRHGFMGGNISSAAIPRLCEELDLNIFIDEIDQNSKDDDILAVLRKGQRRGNPYVRCEGRDNRPVAYDLAGCHGGSFRTELEDAFMNRSLRVHTKKTSDFRLPVINSYKKEILKPLADELFIWHLDNLVVTTKRMNILPTTSLSSIKGSVATCSEEKGVFPDQTHISREELYRTLTQHLSQEEQEFLKDVFGRDNELVYLCLECAKILGLDVLADLREILIKKKSDEASSEGFYLETLRELMIKMLPTFCNKTLQEGQDAGYPYFPKNRLYQSFVQYLTKELNVTSIGTKKFASLLRDLGFIEGVSLRSQRYESLPTPCLIFNAETCKKLELPFEKVMKEKGLPIPIQKPDFNPSEAFK